MVLLNPWQFLGLSGISLLGGSAIVTLSSDDDLWWQGAGEYLLTSCGFLTLLSRYGPL